MKNKFRFKVKALLVGFVLAKVAVTGFVLWGSAPLSVLLSAPEAAVAQDEAALPSEPPAPPLSDDVGRQERLAELQAVSNQLEAKRVALQEEEQRLNAQRKQLETLKREIDVKLEDLKSVQAKIDAQLKRKAEMEAQAQEQQSIAEAAKIKQLVKVYTSMKPKKAAEIIDKLDMKVVHQVFSNMKGEAVGQILTYVSRDRAAEITERMAPPREEK